MNNEQAASCHISSLQLQKVFFAIPIAPLQHFRIIIYENVNLQKNKSYSKQQRTLTHVKREQNLQLTH